MTAAKRLSAADCQYHPVSQIDDDDIKESFVEKNLELPGLEDLATTTKSCQLFAAHLKNLCLQLQNEKVDLERCPTPSLFQETFSTSLKKKKYQIMIQKQISFVQEKLKIYPTLCQSYRQALLVYKAVLPKLKRISHSSKLGRLGSLLNLRDLLHAMEDHSYIKSTYTPFREACGNLKDILDEMDWRIASLFFSLKTISYKLDDLCKPIEGNNGEVVYQIPHPKESSYDFSSKTFQHLHRALNKDVQLLNLEPAPPPPISIPDGLEEAVSLRFTSIVKGVLDIQRKVLESYIFKVPT